eukprot:1115098-Rhodomonas_salina.3
MQPLCAMSGTDTTDGDPRELPDYNATCLEPVTCTDFKFPPNSHGNNLWPLYGEALEIECDVGYERTDGKGFTTRAYCLESGNFTGIFARACSAMSGPDLTRAAPLAMDDPGFSCLRLSCGQYCRYCEGTTLRLRNAMSDIEIGCAAARTCDSGLYRP